MADDSASQMAAFKQAYRESQGSGPLEQTQSQPSSDQMAAFKQAYRESQDSSSSSIDQAAAGTVGDGTGTYSDTAPGVRGKSGDTSTPPQKADAAPTGNNQYTYTGLCAAMNKYEQQLVDSKVVTYPNKYQVKFVDSLGASKVTLSGTVDKSKTPTQQTDSAQKLNPETNSMNKQARTISVLQGTQIMQFIEQTMRNSTYITDQQLAKVDQINSEKAEKSNSTSANNTTKWFKVSVTVTPNSPKIDPKRNDYAYDITYIISPYGINQSESQYFPQATYRGVHKVYNYWFTGLNSQVLHYEQNYHALYFDVMDGKFPSNFTGYAKAIPGISSPWQSTRVPTTASQENDQGATGGANNPASTLADYLYNIGDQGEITLRIVGDPAWIQQGEVLGLNALTFNFNGFYPDGTINTDAQQAVFALNWNSPADYNMVTGLVDVNASATQGNNNNLQSAQTAQTAAYQALKLKSYFNKGRFEQELTGALIQNLNQVQLQNIANQNGRSNTTTSTSTDGVRRALSEGGSSTDTNTEGNNSSTTIEENSSTPASTPPAQPANQPEPPMSGGVDVSSEDNNPAPVILSEPAVNSDENTQIMAARDE